MAHLSHDMQFLLASGPETDIIYDIITKEKLGKIKRELAGLYGSPQRYKGLEAIAKRLGRKATKGGDHGRFWESEDFPDLPHFDIPRHSKPCNKGIVAYVASILEDHDIPAWEARLREEGDSNGDSEANETYGD